MYDFFFVYHVRVCWQHIHFRAPITPGRFESRAESARFCLRFRIAEKRGPRLRSHYLAMATQKQPDFVAIVARQIMVKRTREPCRPKEVPELVWAEVRLAIFPYLNFATNRG